MKNYEDNLTAKYKWAWIVILLIIAVLFILWGLDWLFDLGL